MRKKGSNNNVIKHNGHIEHQNVKNHSSWCNLVLRKILQMTIAGWGTECVKMLHLPEILYFIVAQWHVT